MKNLFGLAALSISIGVSAAAFGAPPKVSIAFDDQFQRSHDISQFQGDVVVVLYGDFDSISANRILGDKIHLAYHQSAKGMPPAKAEQAPVTPLSNLKEGTGSPNVRVVVVACFGRATNEIKNYTNQRFRKELPETALWLDFDNKMKDEFDLKDGETNLLVVDAVGRLRLKMNGDQIPTSYAKVLRAINYLRNEAADGRK